MTKPHARLAPLTCGAVEKGHGQTKVAYGADGQWQSSSLGSVKKA